MIFLNSTMKKVQLKILQLSMEAILSINIFYAKFTLVFFFLVEFLLGDCYPVNGSNLIR